MFKILNCAIGQHDLRLVVVAALICVASTATAVLAHHRAQRLVGRSQVVWIGFTGFVAGAGVWATHFVAMLAYEPSFPVQYEVFGTLASMFVSVVGMAAGFGVAARDKARWGSACGGALAGLGVGLMHFTGMAAVQTPATMIWDGGMVAAAFGIGVGFFALALHCASAKNPILRSGVAAAFLVLAIVGLHFTSMAAITLVPDPSISLSPQLIGRPGLIAMVVMVAVILILAAASILWVERISTRATLHNLQEALDSAPSALAFFDSSCRLMFWNEGYRRVASGLGAVPHLGAYFGELTAKALSSGLLNPETPRAAAWLQFAADDTPRLVTEAPLADGRWFLFDANKIPNGGIVLVISNTTDQHVAQAAMAEAKERAEAASLAKTQFVANMSHEIRTPLNGILGITQLMQRTAQAEAVGHLKVIQDCGESLMAILNDLLDIAKIEAGKMELHRAPFDVAEAVKASCTAFVAMAAQKGVAFNVEVDDSVGLLRLGDGDRIRQVLANLASNAVKFTDAGRIDLTVSGDAAGLEFRVADTGIGIPPERVPELFSRFAQVDASATRRHGGTGLGLALCREFAELMGGDISLESAPEGGSIFSFRAPMPMIVEVEAPEAQPSSAGQDPERRVNLLAAEDNATNRYVLKALLAPFPIDLTLVENGQQAVEAAVSGDFDLILMDVQMPVLDGVEATIAIRAHEAAQGIAAVPIIALSANVMEFQKAQYLAAGMDELVAKPIQVEDLLKTIDAHLSAERVRRAA